MSNEYNTEEPRLLSQTGLKVQSEVRVNCIRALKGRHRTAQGVSPGVRRGKLRSALKGRCSLLRPFRARSMRRGLFPGLTPWAVLLDPFRVPVGLLPEFVICDL